MFAGLNSIKNPQNYRPPPRRGIQAAVGFNREMGGNPAKTKPRRRRGRADFSRMYYDAGFSEKRFNLLPAKSRVIQGYKSQPRMQSFCPRLSFACPSRLLSSRAALAKGQPGSNWGRPTHFSRRGGKKVCVGQVKNSAFTLHSVCIIECRLFIGRKQSKCRVFKAPIRAGSVANPRLMALSRCCFPSAGGAPPAPGLQENSTSGL